MPVYSSANTDNLHSVLSKKRRYLKNSSPFAPVTRLRISDKLTIAEGLAVQPVEERADYVTEKIEV